MPFFKPFSATASEPVDCATTIKPRYIDKIHRPSAGRERLTTVSLQQSTITEGKRLTPKFPGWSDESPMEI